MFQKDDSRYRIQQYEPRFQDFFDLMPHHIREILLVSSLYDSFILEEDGQLGENLYADYFDLQLSYAPRITRVSTGEQALQEVKDRKFDLVISMLRLSDMDVFTVAKKIKKIDKDLPVVLLAYQSDIMAHAADPVAHPEIDRTFIWSGDTKILLAITKLFEDKKNVAHDIEYGDVRVIIIVENSRRYYSLFLPIIYTEIMKQTQALIAEGLNEMHRQLRRRARPKILLAETYEEAFGLYQKYQNNVLGIISDISYYHHGRMDPDAGFKLAQKIRASDPELPLLLMSTQTQNAQKAEKSHVSFLNKNSNSLLLELRHFIKGQLGFGDFIFRVPNGKEIGRAKNLKELENLLATVPDDSIAYHASRNHFSNWLMARTEFALAQKLRPKKISDFENIQQVRQHLIESISQLRKSKQRGVIVEFSRSRFDQESAFVKFSSGSLGGKARGIAFIRALLDKSPTRKNFPDIEIKVPRTDVIGTDFFDEFLDVNNLRQLAIESDNDDDIARAFLKKKLPKTLMENLKFYLQHVNYPLAIRSSSLLEDSQFQPFAGLYSTYMIPNNDPDIKVRLQQLSDAVKLVYASTFYQSPKAYIKSLSRSIEEEKMAVIIQQVVGKRHADLFYPNFSGVAQSYNFYPISYQKPDDGVAMVALGLGKIIVDAGKALRFCPRYPNVLPQFSTPEEILENSQREFFALNLGQSNLALTRDENSTLTLENLDTAEKQGTLSPIGGVYSVNNNIIYDGIYEQGPRVITFSHILKSDLFPLASILNDLLEIGRLGMGCAVQIEFAVNFRQRAEEKDEFYFLQIRPMVHGYEESDVKVDNIPRERIMCATSNALGNGVTSNISDIIYVKPENFSAMNTVKMKLEINKINSLLVEQGRNYILIGPGRWGSSDHFLGIPVAWENISNVKLLVETDLDGFKVEPSQGTHFFQNITSFYIGYFNVRQFRKDSFIDWNWLDSLPAENETDFVRHIRLDAPMEIRIDGRSRKGVILKPEKK
ncbi:MAG: hypothetical protein GXO74_04130 [Calditrichaeota bacterium]|nr:hypothetical protein [Calditrichota bacterium]